MMKTVKWYKNVILCPCLCWQRAQLRLGHMYDHFHIKVQLQTEAMAAQAVQKLKMNVLTMEMAPNAPKKLPSAPHKCFWGCKKMQDAQAKVALPLNRLQSIGLRVKTSSRVGGMRRQPFKFGPNTWYDLLFNAAMLTQLPFLKHNLKQSLVR